MQPQSVSHRLCSLREDVLVETDGHDDQLLLTTMWGDITISDPSPAVRDALERMSMGPVLLENVVPRQRSERARVERVLEMISGCVVHSLGHDDTLGPSLSVVPIARRASFSLPKIERHRPVRLSKFAAMRAHEGEMVMESPLARHRVVIHRPMAANVITMLGKPGVIPQIAKSIDASDDLVKEVVTYLAGAGMVLIGVGDSPATALFAEDHDPLLVPWTHHELLFHSRSRIGRHDNPLGFLPVEMQRVQVAPAVKPVPDGPRFPLFRPAISELAQADPPLTEVIEANAHIRDFSAGEPTTTQLGELLFRAARVRETRQVGQDELAYLVTDRPYPSVANRYELDLYVSVDRCHGLPRGIYHYDPEGHFLTLINSSEVELGELLDVAMVAAGSSQRPPVLITMTARMARFACAYGGIAYSTVLEHVGVLQQTLHLVATAMGLAPCALAFGDSETANDAFLIDWPAEVSVGEIALGVRPINYSAIGRLAEPACFVDAKRHLVVTDRLLY
ncbi:MAG TPA: SagB family peptide dehydrogenase [Candidatus Limnocylindrales bacterium]